MHLFCRNRIRIWHVYLQPHGFRIRILKIQIWFWSNQTGPLWNQNYDVTKALLCTWPTKPCIAIGIDHDTVCAGVVGTAIRHSTSSAGRRAAAPAGTTSAVPDCSTNHDSADRISGQFLFFYHDHYFTKSRGNLRFRRLVPLFVPIGVCVTTHDDRTASDVTIGLWRHNQQATNHERNGKPWFSLPK